MDEDSFCRQVDEAKALLAELRASREKPVYGEPGLVDQLLWVIRTMPPARKRRETRSRDADFVSVLTFWVQLPGAHPSSVGLRQLATGSSQT